MSADNNTSVARFTLPTLLNRYSKLFIKEEYIELNRATGIGKEKFRKENIGSVQIRRSPLISGLGDQFAVPFSGLLILITLVVQFTQLASPVTELLPEYASIILVALSVLALIHIIVTVAVGRVVAQVVITTREDDISVRTRKNEAKQIFNQL